MKNNIYNMLNSSYISRETKEVLSIVIEDVVE